jgi:hypothetical protein
LQTLFVGEALVSNDTSDQLKKFNESLADISTLPEPRLIDGIALTKFDTVDKKVREGGDSPRCPSRASSTGSCSPSLTPSTRR